MNSSNIPSNNDLPSVGKLIKSTILAILMATIILVTVVLPAEYGLDPTGVGQMIGLLKMGEIKVSLASEAALENNAQASGGQIAQPDQPENITPNESATTDVDQAKSDRFSVTLKPNEGKEIKLTMKKGATVDYSWQTDRGVANFDAHADSKTLEIKYHNYEKGKLERSEGVMEAAFDGNHGWFWRNRTSEMMTVTLEVSGDYSEVLRY